MKMHRYRVEKLVRDRLNERMEKLQSPVKTRLLSAAEYQAALKAKLIEEAGEVVASGYRAEQISELADVLEVIHAFAKSLGATMQDIETVRAQKYAERGGFETGLYCEYVDVQSDSELHRYYQEAGDRYEEIEM